MSVVVRASPMGALMAPEGCNHMSRPTQDLFPVPDRNC